MDIYNSIQCYHSTNFKFEGIEIITGAMKKNDQKYFVAFFTVHAVRLRS